MLPGTRLLAFARLMVEPSAVARVLEPLGADWQREWLVAPTSVARAIVRIRGLLAFISSSLYCLAIENVPPDMKRMVWSTLATFTALNLVLDSVDALLGWASRLPIYAVILSLPVAILGGPLAALLLLAVRMGSDRHRRPAARRHLARVTLATTVLTFILTGWAVPYWNRMMRDQIAPASYRRPLALGVNELTLPELMSTDATRRVRLSVHPGPGTFASAQEIREGLHARATAILAPGLLSLLGWSLARASVSWRLPSLVIWSVALWVPYVVVLREPRLLAMPYVLALWTPFIGWAIVAAGLMAWTRESRKRAQV